MVLAGCCGDATAEPVDGICEVYGSSVLASDDKSGHHAKISPGRAATFLVRTRGCSRLCQTTCRGIGGSSL